MDGNVIWVVDTSSVAQVRRSVENAKKKHVFQSMTALVQSGNLVFPKQLVAELGRMADPKSPDAQYQWAKENESKATEHAPNLDEVQRVLAEVPTVLDADKDTGVEEADPYVLALAVQLHNQGKEVRIVTEDARDIPTQMSLRTAAGLLGIPSVPLTAFLNFAKIM